MRLAIDADALRYSVFDSRVWTIQQGFPILVYHSRACFESVVVPGLYSNLDHLTTDLAETTSSAYQIQEWTLAPMTICPRLFPRKFNFQATYSFVPKPLFETLVCLSSVAHFPVIVHTAEEARASWCLRASPRFVRHLATGYTNCPPGGRAPSDATDPCT